MSLALELTYSELWIQGYVKLNNSSEPSQGDSWLRLLVSGEKQRGHTYKVRRKKDKKRLVSEMGLDRGNLNGEISHNRPEEISR